MSNTLFPPITDTMPQWQYTQTLHLTKAAVDNPILVVEDFFNCYSLPNIRYCLHDWLAKSVHKNELMETNLISLHDTIIKLIEASWLLWKKEEEGIRLKGKGRREKSRDGGLRVRKKKRRKKEGKGKEY